MPRQAGPAVYEIIRGRTDAYRANTKGGHVSKHIGHKAVKSVSHRLGAQLIPDQKVRLMTP
ncbi:hypothetical protein EYF80_045858 [Liparis tanakae]|uniref:Uncharacterized protein n=1 Tax=Liparis tanakae TaxID=230148 RepID=A0A4Z2FT98_9TELE|nr:hypothetical protein EYF80_045858 [Liparis tanakae]